jgi:hypothetical protein
VDKRTPTSSENTSPRGYVLGRLYDERQQRLRVDEILGPEIVKLLVTIDAREALVAERGLKAMMLAPTLDLCRALLRGERLPWPKLAYFQAQRYGLRQRPDDGRVSLDDFNDVRA